MDSRLTKELFKSETDSLSKTQDSLPKKKLTLSFSKMECLQKDSSNNNGFSSKKDSLSEQGGFFKKTE